MLESFIQSQKHAVANNLCKKFGRYRALACSSPELIESLFNDLLKRKTQKAILQSGISSMSGISSIDAYLNHFQEVTIPLTELIAMASALYGLPASTVHRFVEKKECRVTVYNGEALVSPPVAQRTICIPVSPASPAGSLLSPVS